MQKYIKGKTLQGGEMVKIYGRPGEIRIARQSKGLSQTDLGNLTGKTFKTISNAETGKPVSTSTAHKICVALGKKFSQLFEFRQEVE